MVIWLPQDCGLRIYLLLSTAQLGYAHALGNFYPRGVSIRSNEFVDMSGILNSA